MGEVFLYNIKGAKAARIKMLCSKLYIGTRDIEPELFGLKISCLLGEEADGEAAENSLFTDEMLYISGVPAPLMSIFLDALRKQKTPVALKAVQTDDNVRFTSYELYKELCAERDALANKEG